MTKGPLVRCEPESLKIESEEIDGVSIDGPKIQMMQGGLEGTKPTILWHIEFSSTVLVRFRCTVEDLRMALDFLEPVKPKRDRKAKAKKAQRIADVFSKVLTPEGGHRG